MTSPAGAEPTAGPTAGRLTETERARLRRWERRLKLAFAGAIGALVAWFGVLIVAPDEPWVASLAVLFASPLVVVGAVGQFSARCPRCGRRIALRSGFLLPDRCASCGTWFRAGPRSGGDDR